MLGGRRREVSAARELRAAVRGSEPTPGAGDAAAAIKPRRCGGVAEVAVESGVGSRGGHAAAAMGRHPRAVEGLAFRKVRIGEPLLSEVASHELRPRWHAVIEAVEIV